MTLTESELGNLKKFIHDEIDRQVRIEVLKQTSTVSQVEISRMASELLDLIESSPRFKTLITEALDQALELKLPIICKTLAAPWEESRETPQLRRAPHTEGYRLDPGGTVRPEYSFAAITNNSDETLFLSPEELALRVREAEKAAHKIDMELCFCNEDLICASCISQGKKDPLTAHSIIFDGSDFKWQEPEKDEEEDFDDAAFFGD